MRYLVLAVCCLIACAPARGEERTYRTGRVVVSYADAVPVDYVKAIARTVDLAVGIAAGRFGLDVPRTVFVSVRINPKQLRLFNDGKDRVYLTIRSMKDLGKPGSGAPLMVYGLCHEVGHLNMYRVIRERGWMTTAAAEGWAHYMGQRIVDDVHARAGEALWPDRHDYLLTGTRRLTKQLAAGDPGPTAKGAGLWRELGTILGDKGLARLFQVWARVKVEPEDPAAALGRAMQAACAPKDRKRLAAWWRKAGPVFTRKREKSDFPVRTARLRDLGGRPLALSHDDGEPAGRSSMAGSGHAVRFEAKGDTWYLTAVGIHGSRYGPPAGEFRVWLCDADFRAVTEFAFPFAKFEPGKPKWVALPVGPINVPPKFIVCAAFNPTGSKGVFVSRDGAGSGHSLTGTPGGPPAAFAGGDWMIRVRLDKLKAGAKGRLPRHRSR